MNVWNITKSLSCNNKNLNSKSKGEDSIEKYFQFLKDTEKKIEKVKINLLEKSII